MSKKNRKHLILVIAVLAVSSLACTLLDTILPDSGSNSTSPDIPDISDTTDTSDTVDTVDTMDTNRISDDFSNENSGWEIGVYEYGDVGYNDGKYRVTAAGNSTMWGAGGINFQDLIINVEAKQVAGPENNNNDYGVVCRLQPEGNGYYGLISGDGYYTIIRLSGEDAVDILVDWTESRVINQGNSTNQIEFSCQGNKIILSINDKLVAETSDNMFSSGDIGLTAASYEEVGVVVDFDNLTVK